MPAERTDRLWPGEACAHHLALGTDGWCDLCDVPPEPVDNEASVSLRIAAKAVQLEWSVIPEMAMGAGRVDLVITRKPRCFVVEVKREFGSARMSAASAASQLDAYFYSGRENRLIPQNAVPVVVCPNANGEAFAANSGLIRCVTPETFISEYLEREIP